MIYSFRTIRKMLETAKKKGVQKLVKIGISFYVEDAIHKLVNSKSLKEFQSGNLFHLNT